MHITFFFLYFANIFMNYKITYLLCHMTLGFFRDSNCVYVESPLHVFQIYYFLIKRNSLALILFYNVYISHYYSPCFLLSFQSIDSVLLLPICIHLVFLGVYQVMFSFFLLNNHIFPTFLCFCSSFVKIMATLNLLKFMVKHLKFHLL